ncbi:hypothetical protein pipiens_002276 [Culex pipiens pipiens]|uniref:BZIP domain-containing protein n=1 Tax=Culex pipiens pipiens TaxID=38569 RepID=A0ABD1DKT3_CULPP
MMAQFMMDLKTEHRTSPSLYPPSSPKMHENYRPDSTDSGVLDLSKRRDSVETRRTPSPYNSFSENGSPPFQNSSPINSTNALLMNYHAMQQRHHRELSPKAAMPYESPNHLELRHPAMPMGFLPAQGFPLIPKQENLPVHRPEIASYLLQSGAIPPQHQFPHSSPIHPARESDSLSESGSEGQLIGSTMKLPQLKIPSETSSNTSGGTYPMVVGRDGKLARPFKAYPRDPLSLATGFMSSGSILDANSAEKYNMFRKRMLEQIHAANGGQPTVSNPKMRRLNKSLSDASETESVPERTSESIEHQSHQSKQPSDNTPTECSSSSSKPCQEDASNGGGERGMVKDSAYYERRKKNNAAAKKSRDRRRIKEDEIAIRAAFLERENIELKFELAAARKQLALYGVAGAGSP